MKKLRKPALSGELRMLATEIINRTEDGSVGYDEAANHVSETWAVFEDAGATVSSLEHITGFIRWMKFEGFCAASPLT